MNGHLLRFGQVSVNLLTFRRPSSRRARTRPRTHAHAHTHAHTRTPAQKKPPEKKRDAEKTAPPMGKNRAEKGQELARKNAREKPVGVLDLSSFVRADLPPVAIMIGAYLSPFDAVT